MLHTVWLWLLAGSPAHYLQLLACAVVLFIEAAIPRIPRLKANSTVQLVANFLLPYLLPVPFVGKMLAFLAHDAVMAKLLDAKCTPLKGNAPLHDKPMPAFLPLAFLLGLGVMVPSCSQATKDKLAASESAFKACAAKYNVTLSGASADLANLELAMTELCSGAVALSLPELEAAAMQIGTKYGPMSYCDAQKLYAIWKTQAPANASTPRVLMMKHLVVDKPCLLLASCPVPLPAPPPVSGGLK